jgi:Tfp pilus assembly protein PilE
MKQKIYGKGISLIVLVITIIVIIILAGTVILSLADNNPIEQANEAKFKKNISEYNSQLEMAIAKEYLEDNSFNASTFSAGVWDGTEDHIAGTIKEYISSITTADKAKFVIHAGKLQISKEAVAQEIEWASDIGIELASTYLADVVSVGDYVAYPVNYDNVPITDPGGGLHLAGLTGWRVLNVSNGIVKLVSAGIPLQADYIYMDGGDIASEVVERWTTNFTTTTFSSISGSTMLNNIYATGACAMKKEDLDGCVAAGVQMTDDLISTGSSTAMYWLATVAPSGRAIWTYSEGALYEYPEYYWGIRPVITLKTGLDTTGKIGDVWQIAEP